MKNNETSHRSLQKVRNAKSKGKCDSPVNPAR